MALTPLPSQAYLNSCFAYDAGTGVLRWRRRPDSHFKAASVARVWNHRFADKEAGNRHPTNGYIAVKLDGRLFKAHRLIWKIMTGEDPDQVDHANLKRDDNRWENLRECTLAQNVCNSRRYRNNKSGFKGVSVRNGRWRATIQVSGRAKTLGTFPSPEAAHAAYCVAARHLHGEFASFG